MKKLFLIVVLSYSIICNSQTYPRSLVRPTIGEFMGVDVRDDVVSNIIKLNKIPNIRFFHYWSDDVNIPPTRQAVNFDEKTSLMKYKYNTTFNGNIGAYEYDNYFSTRIMPVMTAISPWMRGYSQVKFKDKNNNDSIASDFDNRLYQQKPLPLKYPYVFDGVKDTTKIVQIGNNTYNDKYGKTPWDYYMLSANEQKNPNNYISIAKRLSMFVERYGNVPFNATCHEYYKNSYDIAERKKQDFYTGRNNAQYVECYNETDKTWLDIDPNRLGTDSSWFQMSAPQLGAMLSACYDGHSNSPFFKVNDTCNSTKINRKYLGIKNIDPRSQLVFPGVAEFRGAYVKNVINWAIANRNSSTINAENRVPFDVINFHHYSTNVSRGSNLRSEVNDLQFSNYFGPFGISPDKDDISGDIKYCLAQMTDNLTSPYLANKPVWITEFGWDSKKEIDDESFVGVRCKDCTIKERRIRQGQWLIRGFLHIANTNQIDRAYMYEAADDKLIGTYGSCGLFTENYATKKESYYYYMTLLNVLKSYYHDYTNAKLNIANLTETNNYKRLNTDIDQSPLKFTLNTGNLIQDSIYCFKFKNSANKVVYAIWSGTSDSLKTQSRSGTINLPIHFPKTISGISIITPSILDEDGIKSRFNTFTTAFMPLQRIGKDSVIDHQLLTLNNLSISETPIFIMMDDTASDKSRPSNISDLTYSSACCGTVKLKWTLPTTNKPDHYQIYYTLLKDTVNNTDLSKLKLADDNVLGSSNSYYVSGLDKNLMYRFWVIPFNSAGDPVSADFADYRYIDILQINNCTSCISTPSSIVYNNPNNITTNPSKIFNVYKTGCDSLFTLDDSLCKYAGWDDWNTTNNPQFIVDFGKDVIIPAMYINNNNGTGRIKFEYFNCQCDDWQDLTTVITKYAACTSSDIGWKSYPNFSLIPIRKLRITKLDASINPKRINFCTENALCAPKIKGESPKSLNFDYIGTDNVNISFTTATITDSLGIAYKNIKDYDAKISSQWEGDSLINPIAIPISTKDFAARNEITISYLTPNTTYKLSLKAKVKCVDEIPIEIANDRNVIQPLVGIFTTQSIVVDNNIVARKAAPAGTVPMVQPKMFIYPNPTQNEVNISLPFVGYNMIELLDISGKLIFTYYQNPASKNLNIDTQELTTGVYILRAQGINVPILNSKMMKE
jgi:Secretion system C-terminal sorting domain